MKKISFCENWTFKKTLDKDAKVVTVPHDAMIHESRKPNNASGSAQAYFPGGAYVYEKVFAVPEEWKEQHVAFQFEGVYKNAKVYINDKEAGGAAYGYIPFFIKASHLLQYGCENVIRVEAENLDQPDSRWYSGAGIYRPVWLWIGKLSHIEAEGIRITTLDYEPARIRVEVRHTGDLDTSAWIEIRDGEKTLAEGLPGDFDLSGARLWNENSPALYICRVTLKKEGQILDQAQTKFGIRLVEWNSQGLFINGQNTLLRGGCIHHDNGILGAATYDLSEARRVRLLKEAGFNAIRSSHNPISRAMLDACDTYGVYVIDESWDMWFLRKNKYDYANQWRKQYLFDLQAMVDRDFNHPSVIMYSIGNEVSEPARDEGVKLTREMVDYLHQADPGRAVTGGFNLFIIHSAAKGKSLYKEEGGLRSDNHDSVSKMNSTLFNLITHLVGTGMNKGANSKAADKVTTPCLDSLDIAGYNYASGRYPLEGKAHPNRLIFGSETFPQDIARNWAEVKKYPYLIGDFMWTAWDYLGEVGLGAWAYTKDGKGFNKPYPWLLADCGAFDILGNPGAPVALARASWEMTDTPFIGVQPMNQAILKPYKAVWRGTNAISSWSWQGCEGKPAVVEVFSSAAFVELLLDGKSLGKKKISLCKATFKTRYRPGNLSAVAFNGQGQVTGRKELTTAKGAIRIELIPEADRVKAGDLVYLNISLVGENGIIESNADTCLSIAVEGGELLAFGSANPRTEDRFDSGSYTTYYGRALAIVRANQAGLLKIKATGPDLIASTELRVLNND